MKKKMQFIIPKAKQAFSIAHVLFVFSEIGLLALALAPAPLMLKLAPKLELKEKLVQSALAMNRSS